MDASIVFGQSGFKSVNPLVGPEATATSLGTPYSVAIDGGGNLWVADTANSRVLKYAPPFSNGMAATLAIGQTDTGAASVCFQVPMPQTVCYPTGASFDAKGDLWVTDASNNRVLEYSPPFSTGMSASLELGQPSATAFTSGSSDSPSASSLFAPVALAFDSTGNLWLTDFGFNRVLEYVPPFSNGMAATTVLGQVDFMHGDPNQNSNRPTANTLTGPWGLAFDSNGNLNVTDTGNNRVLIFKPPLSMGMKASTVIGQSNFDSGTEAGSPISSPTESTLLRPLGLLTF
jgi:NHL repeat.